MLPIDWFIHLWDVTWAAYVIASSCRADRQPRSMVSSGMVTLYQTSGGLTLDRELVSTTGSGCRRPTFTAWRSWLVSYRTPRLVWSNRTVIGLTLTWFYKEKEVAIHYETYILNKENTYASLACTLHTFLHVPVPPLPPPQVHLLPWSQDAFGETVHTFDEASSAELLFDFKLMTHLPMNVRRFAS